MKIFWAICLIILISFSTNGQNKAIEKAKQSFDKDHFNKALKTLNKCIHEDSTNIDALILRAKCYRRQGDYANANKDLDMALIFDPNNDRIYCEKGVIQSIYKKYSIAIRYFNKSKEMNPKSAEPHICLGATYYMLDSISFAINEYCIAIELEPNKLLSYLNRGLAYQKNKLYVNAIDDFTKFLKQNSRRSRAFYFRGQCYYAIGEYNKAVDDLTNAIKYYNNDDPYEMFTFRNLYYERAQCYLALKKTFKYNRDMKRWKKH